MKMQCLLLLVISSAGRLANAAEGEKASIGCKAGADADASFIQQTQAALGKLTSANLALQQAIDAKVRKMPSWPRSWAIFTSLL